MKIDEGYKPGEIEQVGAVIKFPPSITVEQARAYLKALNTIKLPNGADPFTVIAVQEFDPWYGDPVFYVP